MPSSLHQPLPGGARAVPRLRQFSGFRVFIDFDNTITRGDVLDRIVERYSETTEWRSLEDAWVAGRIGARACLDGQMRGLRATWPEFAEVLDSVELDPGFADLQRVLRLSGTDFTILSDNFDLFLGHILRRHGMDTIPYRANHLDLEGDRVVPSFPFGNPECPGCAHCKKVHFMPPHDDARAVVFIGDGKSDICPSTHADLVFAKDNLLSHLRRAGVPCRGYADLGDVAGALSTILRENKF
jgi:2-hydroxy-3-keto-5-methylthiopentenyl-1-phosphate phosphatase